jgi:hypothetical protein
VQKYELVDSMTKHRLVTRSLRERTFCQPAGWPADELVGAA